MIDLKEAQRAQESLQKRDICVFEKTGRSCECLFQKWFHRSNKTLTFTFHSNETNSFKNNFFRQRPIREKADLRVNNFFTKRDRPRDYFIFYFKTRFLRIRRWKMCAIPLSTMTFSILTLSIKCQFARCQYAEYRLCCVSFTGMGEIKILAFSAPFNLTERRKISVSILLNIVLLHQIFTN